MVDKPRAVPESGSFSASTQKEQGRCVSVLRSDHKRTRGKIDRHQSFAEIPSGGGADSGFSVSGAALDTDNCLGRNAQDGFHDRVGRSQTDDLGPGAPNPSPTAARAPWPLDYQAVRWVNLRSRWDVEPVLSLRVRLEPGQESILRDKRGLDWVVSLTAWEPGRVGRLVFERVLKRALTGAEANAKHPPKDYVAFFTGCSAEAARRLHLDLEELSPARGGERRNGDDW